MQTAGLRKAAESCFPQTAVTSLSNLSKIKPAWVEPEG